MTDTPEMTADDADVTMKLRREATGFGAGVRRILGKKRYRWPLYVLIMALLAVLSACGVNIYGKSARYRPDSPDPIEVIMPPPNNYWNSRSHPRAGFSARTALIT